MLADAATEGGGGVDTRNVPGIPTTQSLHKYIYNARAVEDIGIAMLKVHSETIYRSRTITNYSNSNDFRHGDVCCLEGTKYVHPIQ